MTKLQQDAENMEEIMCRTADRCDIWQDRYIYWIAVAIWHIIQRLNRLERRGKEGRPDMIHTLSKLFKKGAHNE